MPLPLAISTGDPAGVGPVVTAAALARSLGTDRAFVYGDAAWMERALRRYGFEAFKRLDKAEAASLAPIVAEEASCAARLLSAAGVDRWIEVWEKINSLADQTDRLNLGRKQIVLNMFAAIQGAMRA